jgi:hypothetical protein
MTLGLFGECSILMLWAVRTVASYFIFTGANDDPQCAFRLSQSPASSDLPETFSAPAYESDHFNTMAFTRLLLCNRLKNMDTQNMTISPAPWHSAYPAPRNPAVYIPRDDVLDLIKQSAEASSKHYFFVDLRRNDHDVILIIPMRF